AFANTDGRLCLCCTPSGPVWCRRGKSKSHPAGTPDRLQKVLSTLTCPPLFCFIPAQGGPTECFIPDLRLCPVSGGRGQRPPPRLEFLQPASKLS
ncbi:hypothetical protein GOODEAATRI_003063, partial [Goodea atripinnis]